MKYISEKLNQGNYGVNDIICLQVGCGVPINLVTIKTLVDN